MSKKDLLEKILEQNKVIVKLVNKHNENVLTLKALINFFGLELKVSKEVEESFLNGDKIVNKYNFTKTCSETDSPTGSSGKK